MVEAASITVKKGPEYCDKDGCISWDELKQDCAHEIKWGIAKKVIGATIKIATSIADPAAAAFFDPVASLLGEVSPKYIFNDC